MDVAGDWRLRLFCLLLLAVLLLILLLVLAVDCRLTSSAFVDDSSSFVDASSALSRSNSFCNATSGGDGWSTIGFLFYRNLRSSFFVRVGMSFGISSTAVACCPFSNDSKHPIDATVVSPRLIRVDGLT